MKGAAEVKPNRNGTLAEKCAWLRRRQGRSRPSERWTAERTAKTLRPLGRRHV